MGFWGLQVDAGASVKVNPGPNRFIHISQAALDTSLDTREEGEERKPAHLYVTDDQKQFFIGFLSQGDMPQCRLDLLFEKEFELSHSLNSGTVHFSGYSTSNKRENESESMTPFSSKKAKHLMTGKSVVEPCLERKAILKKWKILKEIKKLKKSIKELSEAMKDLQEIQNSKADRLDVLWKQYHEELKLELTGSAVDGEPVVEEEGDSEDSFPVATFSETVLTADRNGYIMDRVPQRYMIPMNMMQKKKKNRLKQSSGARKN